MCATLQKLTEAGDCLVVACAGARDAVHSQVLTGFTENAAHAAVNKLIHAQHIRLAVALDTGRPFAIAQEVPLGNRGHGGGMPPV